jgi:putative transposase
LDYQTKLDFIIPDHPGLSLNSQTQTLGISRSHFYYQPASVSAEEIQIMEFMDKIFTDCPFYGSRKIQAELTHKPYNIFICREHVQRLMREMGLEAIYPKSKKGLSDPNSQHIKYPYLLKNLPIIRPNQVWGTDITYIRLLKGFCYLVAIIDWYSRYVVAWALSETLDIDFCLENLKTALSLAIPEIFNSDQGSHFTSPQHTGLLTAHPAIQISMDGRGRCMDNIFTERLWRTVKYEHVYLHDHQTTNQAEQGLKEYFNFYNHKRIHQSLDYQTPAQIYFQN